MPSASHNENCYPQLPLLQLRLRFISDKSWRWPSHPGSAWRGAFGWALKRAVCAMRLRSCTGCPLGGSCLYPYVFDTAPPDTAKMMTRYERAPHPFALHVGPLRMAALPPGEPLEVCLTLIGNACRHTAFFIHALQLAGEAGVGSARLRFSLESVVLIGSLDDRELRPLDWGSDRFRPPQAALVAPPPGGERCRLVLETPLRLKSNGRLVTPERFQPADMLSSLVRRIAMLMYFHTDTPLQADFRALKEAASRVTLIDPAFRWHEMTRRSSRQNATMQTGGIVGSAILDFSDAPELRPFLCLGEIVQAGKGTSMGLGFYRLSPLA